MAVKVVITVVIAVFLALATGDTTFSIYQTPEEIIANGYPAERHHVVTEDGYILEMHRIPRGKEDSNSSTPRPVVFMMHGLLSSSQSFILLGPRSGLAYNFADAGFDVWLGNARGNKLSRKHTSLNPDDSREKMQFFDFSFEEIGMIDVAAMVDYALEFTGQSQLHYIGHSQGGTVFFVLASMKAEYNNKFKSVHLLAGVGYMNHFPNTNLTTMAANTDMIYQMSVLMGAVELFPPNTTNAQTGYSLGPDYCTGVADHAEMCRLMGIPELMTRNDAEPNLDVAGAALKQIAHYGQNIRDKTFRRWNFGSSQNSAVYGQSTPPEYDLGLITSQVIMHYTISDNLLDERDVLAMAADMPNATVRKVPRDTFLHEDFVVADDCKELVTDFIIEAMLQLEPNAAYQITGNQILRICLLLFSIKLMI